MMTTTAARLALFGTACILAGSAAAPASTIYVFNTPPGGLNPVTELVRLSDGVPVERHTLGLRPHFGRNSTHLVTIAGRADGRGMGEVTVWDLASGARVRAFEPSGPVRYAALQSGGALPGIMLDAGTKRAYVNGFLDPINGGMVAIDLDTGEVSRPVPPDAERLARVYTAGGGELLLYQDGSLRHFSYATGSFSGPLPDKAEPCLDAVCYGVSRVGLVRRQDGTLEQILDGEWRRVEPDERMRATGVDRVIRWAKLYGSASPCYVSQDEETGTRYLICLDPKDFRQQIARTALPAGAQLWSFSGPWAFLMKDQTAIILNIESGRIANTIDLSDCGVEIAEVRTVLYWPSLVPAEAREGASEPPATQPDGGASP